MSLLNKKSTSIRFSHVFSMFWNRKLYFWGLIFVEQKDIVLAYTSIILLLIYIINSIFNYSDVYESWLRRVRKI